ncbi:hypothetical protein M8818_003992 [Zalaria obscura]|uniref:Uncharacterized protein n=1 Tax=Zalaria obscura TaxID=2024903 RepID=A0ACC3SE73_9PEZI
MPASGVLRGPDVRGPGFSPTPNPQLPYHRDAQPDFHGVVHVEPVNSCEDHLRLLAICAVQSYCRRQLRQHCNVEGDVVL